MRSLRQWVGARMASGFLPAVIAVFVCSPAGVAVALAGVPHDGGAQTSRSARIGLGGLTSNGWPVYIELAGNGRSIVRAVGAINAPCKRGGSIAAPVKWIRLPIRHGRFKAAHRDSFREAGAKIALQSTFAGKVNRARTVVSGTWRNKIVVDLPDGSTETCDSGVLRFRAR